MYYRDMKKKYVIGIVFVVLMVSLFYLKRENNTRALFSWRSEVISEEADELIEFISDNKFNTLYQEFDLDDVESIQAFGNKTDIQLYHLCGSPDWDIERIKEEILAVYKVNQDITTNIKGLVVDIEPYLKADWDKNKKKIMNSYIDDMIEANEYAAKLGLEYFLCIPYWYEAGNVDRLVKDGCDGLVVMNYYKGKELEHLSDEMESCFRYNKELVTAFEMQEAGKHDLSENNTYHDEGLGVVNEIYEKIYNRYPRIGLAVHYYDVLK